MNSMNPSKSAARSSFYARWTRLFATLLLIPFLTAGLSAQSASTGTITGRVFDEATGRSLHGAVVRIRGTNNSDFTNADGRFLISSVPAGAVSLEVEYI